MVRISEVYLLVSFLSSSVDNFFLSTQIPPFDPPKGNSNKLVLNVIKKANAFISSRVTSGEYLKPPFAGPRKVE